MFDYKLKLSKRRKTVAIRVTPEQVVVLAPENVCHVSMRQWLATKQSWVKQQQLKLLDAPSLQNPMRSRTLLIFGVHYQIVYDAASTSSLCHQKKMILLPQSLADNEKKLRATLIQLLVNELVKYLDEHLIQYAKAMKCSISSVKVREYKSRWGSCSSKKALTFNCLLLGAPKHMINYVIVHELAHCHVLAHNAHFWAIVEKHFQAHKQARRWFKENGKSLMIE